MVLVWRVGTSDARQPPAASGSRVSPSSHEADPATRTERESIRLPHAPRTHLAASPRFTTRRRLYHASLTPYRLGSLRLQNYTHSDPYRGGGFSLSLVSWLPPLQRGANSIRKKKKKWGSGRDENRLRVLWEQIHLQMKQHLQLTRVRKTLTFPLRRIR